MSDLIKTDPYEGAEPRSHVEAMSGIIQKHLDDMGRLRDQFPIEGKAAFDELMKNSVDKYSTVRDQVNAKFGVNCWHKNDDESDGMWRLYTAMGQGVAIESTSELLKSSLVPTNGLIFGEVHYADFEHDPIEKGHAHYGGFMKRKCFEHEQEYRATLLLEKNAFSNNVPCNLNTLIVAVHVSPTATSVFQTAVEALCGTYLKGKPVRHSRLLEPPAYSIRDYLKT